MNLQQLEYILSVEKCRHFGEASENCNVSQSTLSTMIQRLEDEIGVKIFDRSTQPISTTEVGDKILRQSEVILQNVATLRDIANDEKNIVRGEFRLAIIPTIAPYMVPKLLQANPADGNVELILSERTTDRIIADLLTAKIDGGLLAGPLNHSSLSEYPLYYEKFYAYVGNDELANEKELDLNGLDLSRLWLLENVHCFRGQIERLCRLKRENQNRGNSTKYEAGSIDTLMNIVDANGGLTIIPEMAAMSLPEDRQDHLRRFKSNTAVRCVCLATNKKYSRKKLLDIIQNIVRASVPKSMLDASLKKYVVDL